jgi:hypothetical protein
MEMISLVLTVIVLVGVYFLQQSNALVAGFVAVAPVKIIAASSMTLEDGGLDRLREALGGMLIGQFVWGLVLLALWFALR